MRCLRSGYCCIKLDVIIVDDPLKGLQQDNIKHKPSGEVCQHLIGDGAGSYSCAIHDYDWYMETPCYDHSQIEAKDSPCRIGNYVLNNPLPTT